MNNQITHLMAQEQVDAAVAAWQRGTLWALYTMDRIIADIMGNDPVDEKEAQRLSPMIGHSLRKRGWINRRMRGPVGNRHYWMRGQQ